MSSIDAPIRQVAHDLISGKTRLDFGPSPMFGVADFLELFRARLKKKPDTATLDPEEEPEPIQYRANAVNRAMQRGSTGGAGDSGEEGTVSVRIFKPLGDPSFDISLVGWAISGTGGGRNGNGDATFPLPVGNYSIVRFFPAGYVSSVDTSPQSTFTVVKGATVFTDIGVIEAERLRLMKRLDGGEALEIDANVNDIPSDGEGKSLKVREIDAVFMGEAAKIRILASEFHPPPEQ